MSNEVNDFLITIDGSVDTEKKQTKTLLDTITFNGILEKSCIWLQILFSFLYWNEETDKSRRKIINNFETVKSDNIDPFIFQFKEDNF
jgi:hypothetical protein